MAIIFTVTTAGKNAALDAQRRGLSVSLTKFVLGKSKGSATAGLTNLRSSEANRLNFNTIVGDVERQSSTLRFSVTMESSSVFDAYEMGLFTDTGVLFAVASTAGANPLLRLHPDVAVVVGSFGLHLGDVDASVIRIVNDPSSPMAVKMMQEHNAANDPHPQYLKDSEFNTAAADILRRLAALEAKEIIPVGGLFITTNHYATGEDVAHALGYGTWKRYAKGMTLVGHDPDVRAGGQKTWWSDIGSMAGEYSHQLTIDEMPSHTHDWLHGREQDDNSFGSHADEFTFAPGRQSGVDVMSATGNDKPHNNIQPSIVVAVWVRVVSTSTAVPELYRNNDASAINANVLTDMSELSRNIDEMRSRIEALQRELALVNVGGNWKARVVLESSFGYRGDTNEKDYHWLDPTITQIAGITKEVVVNATRSGSGFLIKFTGDIVVTFNDNTDVSKIVVTPEPENLVRGENTLTWSFPKYPSANSRKEWLLSLTS